MNALIDGLNLVPNDSLHRHHLPVIVLYSDGKTAQILALPVDHPSLLLGILQIRYCIKKLKAPSRNWKKIETQGPPSVFAFCLLGS